MGSIFPQLLSTLHNTLCRGYSNAAVVPSVSPCVLASHLDLVNTIKTINQICTSSWNLAEWEDEPYWFWRSKFKVTIHESGYNLVNFSRDHTVECILFKLDTVVAYEHDKRMNQINIRGQMSKVKVTIDNLWAQYCLVYFHQILHRAGDADSSRAPGLTSGLQGSVNVHCGALFLVPQ